MAKERTDAGLDAVRQEGRVVGRRPTGPMPRGCKVYPATILRLFARTDTK